MSGAFAATRPRALTQHHSRPSRQMRRGILALLGPSPHLGSLARAHSARKGLSTRRVRPSRSAGRPLSNFDDGPISANPVSLGYGQMLPRLPPYVGARGQLAPDCTHDLAPASPGLVAWVGVGEGGERGALDADKP